MKKSSTQNAVRTENPSKFPLVWNAEEWQFVILTAIRQQSPKRDHMLKIVREIAFNGIVFVLTVYDNWSQGTVGNRDHSFMWAEKRLAERYHGFAHTKEFVPQFEGFMWRVVGDSVHQVQQTLYRQIMDEFPLDFTIGQAVRTQFWSKNEGRVISICHPVGLDPYYEVQTADGRIVLEPAMYLQAAPELEAVLPPCKPRAPLTEMEIQDRLDTPSPEPDTRQHQALHYGWDDLNKYAIP
jgi:hypothetical protein